ncbi:hypothetical protein HDU76_007532 [Blyttiomyces sp. JEL0837]|nr:hypothetical protein HDU76_007532 [Blyttiomyces sp. JEL0837]
MGLKAGLNVDPVFAVTNEGYQMCGVFNSDGKIVGVVLYSVLRDVVFVDGVAVAEDFKNGNVEAVLIKRIQKIASVRNKAAVVIFSPADLESRLKSKYDFEMVPRMEFHPNGGRFMFWKTQTDL